MRNILQISIFVVSLMLCKDIKNLEGSWHVGCMFELKIARKSISVFFAKCIFVIFGEVYFRSLEFAL